jgi:hypothetical protein
MRRADPAKRGEEQPHALLHLPVGIENHPIAGVVDEANGQAQPELPPSGLVQHPTPQPRPDHVQLRLRHRPLQAEKQAVVEVHRVIKTVFVQDQRPSERADLQQPVPIARVARQA